MHHQRAVRIGNRIAHRQKHFQSALLGRPHPTQPGIQFLALGQFHHQPGLAIVQHATIDQTRDAGMIQTCQHPALAFQLLLETRILATQQFDRGTLVERAIGTFGQIHRAHAALTDFFQQPPRPGTQAAPIGGAFARDVIRQCAQRGQAIVLRQRAAQIGNQVRVDFPAQREKPLACLTLQFERTVDQRLQPGETGVDVVHAIPLLAPLPIVQPRRNDSHHDHPSRADSDTFVQRTFRRTCPKSDFPILIRNTEHR